LYFDRPIMDVPHLVLVDPPQGVQWLFNKGESVGNDATNASANHHIHAVISAADDWMEHEESEIVRRVMADVHHALPQSRGIEPVEARTIKEKRATFAAVPGVDALRPTVSPSVVGGPGVDNLFLAGDWTDTGWPATMEGAVRSGYMAAAAIVGDDNTGPVNDLAPGPLARLLGLR
jgi:zeta-carotene desaturase